jgi:alkanesulfonate monooxygenase SsuD/methylene tetrahydromethanopterin reductase-like flavin-dependent oxidoreductase (luciferase family)
VYWLMHPDLMAPRWEHYQRTYEEAHHTQLRAGENRVLVVNTHVGRTREAAMTAARNGHDEFARFLAPYGRFTNYLEADGTKKPFGVQPTLEESVNQQIAAIGSVDDVVDIFGMYRERFGVEHLCLFLDLPGLSREQITEQLHLLAEEVFPKLGTPLTALPAPEQSIRYTVPS